MQEKTITLRMPDDWHCHFRDADLLATTVPHAAERFRRAIVMPNLVPPIDTIEATTAYHQRLRQHIPRECNFEPLMTLYLTDSTTPELIQKAHKHPLIHACKLYPAGATTHSAAGIHHIASLYPVFETMEAVGLPLLIHGEMTDPSIDIFDRECRFIDKILAPLLQDFPELRVVLEHITTAHAVDFIQSQAAHVGATITVHHCWLTRNDLLVGGIRPDLYCLPIVKRDSDRHALRQAAFSGNSHFFLGTDSAPHAKNTKHSACGCAGIYTAHAAIELLAVLFEEHQALAKLEAFVSINGAHFYRLPINTETITLVRKPWRVPDQYHFGESVVTPFFAGQTIAWQISP